MEAKSIDIRPGENYFQWISRSTKIVNKENEQIPFDSLNDKTFLGIYFAANWIPVSKNYLHIIDNAVNAMEARDGSSMGMLLASCDQNDKDMIEFVTTANNAYPIIPPDSKLIETLKEKFEIEEIPILVVLNVENNSIVDKVDKLRLECLLEKEDPDALCDKWLGVSNTNDNDIATSSPFLDKKLNEKEKKQQARLAKVEKKKLEKVEKTEQKKVAKFEKQKSKELKRLKRKNLHSVQDDTASVNSESLLDDSEQTVLTPEAQADADTTAFSSVATDQGNGPSGSLACNALAREGNENLSDGSEGSIDVISGKRKKKKRTLWGRTDTPKQKEAESQLATLLHRNNELEHLLIELEKNKQEQETENAELHSQVDSLNGTIADKDKGLNELEGKNKELSGQLSMSCEENKALKKDKEILSQELDGVKQDLNQTKEELKNKLEQIEEIEQERQVRETEHQKFLEITELKGWMHKRGRKNFTRGMWRNRFFQVGEGFKLHYYKSPKMKSLRGFINLGDVVKVEPVKDDKHNLLTIATDSSSLELRAPDETTRDNWINSINFLTHYCKKYHSQNETHGDDALLTEGAVDETVSGTDEKQDEPNKISKPSESIEISPVTAN